MTVDRDKQSVRRNAKRRKLYAEDPEVRRKAIESTRGTYRAVNGGLMDPSTCLDNLDDLGSYGTKRLLRREKRVRVTFSIGELAIALNRRPEVVYRWVRSKILPQPNFILQEPLVGTHWFVYSMDQVRALVEVMGRHQLNTPYYRRDHNETRNDLFHRFTKAT